MTVIEIPDEQAEALKARAAAEGLTLEAWLKRLAEEERWVRARSREGCG
jgi:plasmid stability protein